MGQHAASRRLQEAVSASYESTTVGCRPPAQPLCSLTARLTHSLAAAAAVVRVHVCVCVSLKKGFKLDVFDTSSVPPQWMEAEVTAVRRSAIDVHYTGWSDKYDTTIESSEYKERIAPLGSYSEDVIHYSCCLLCDEGGDNRTLVCCDGCPRVVHLQCGRLRAPPAGDYFCPDCVKHKRGKRLVGDKRDATQYEEDDDEQDDDEDERLDEEREKENRTNRAGGKRAAAARGRRGAAAASKAARPASPNRSATSSSSVAEARRSDVRPSDRRALATKAGRSRLGEGAGLVRRVQHDAASERESIDVDDDDDGDVMEEDTERKKQPPASKKRARSDVSSVDQSVGSRTRTAAVSSSSSRLLHPTAAALPRVPQPVPPPPIHLATGLSSAANQSTRKRIRSGGTQQKQQQIQLQQQQQQQDDGSAVNPMPESVEEKQEPRVEGKKPTEPLTSFVDCYRYHADRRGKGTATSSSASSSSSSSVSSFTTDGLPLVGIPPFSFPSSNFDDSAGDAYIAHFCSLLDMAEDKVSLSVRSELPGVERWEIFRARMEEVSRWMRMKCNQQINGEQVTVKDGHQFIERQSKQWREQLDLYEQRLKEATERRETTTKAIEDIDKQIEQLRQQREQRRQELAKREQELSQLSLSKEEAKREHDRKVTEQEANVRRAVHRVSMLRDLSDHVAARREEGDEKDQSGQYWEPLDTIQRRCTSMTSAMRLREVDRTSSNSSAAREEAKAEEKRPPHDDEEESKTDPQHSVDAAMESCIDAAMNAVTSQSQRHSQRRDVYQQNSFVDEAFDEAAAELRSADVPTPLHMRHSAFLTNVRLSSASFGSLSSLSSASTISEVPHVMLSSSEDSVSSTQTTLPVSPSHGEGAVEVWEVHQRLDVAEQEQKVESKEADGAMALLQADDALPLSTALSDLSRIRRMSGENMDELTAVAERQLTPEKKSAASEPSEQDGTDSAAVDIASGTSSAIGPNGNGCDML